MLLRASLPERQKSTYIPADPTDARAFRPSMRPYVLSGLHAPEPLSECQRPHGLKATSSGRAIAFSAWRLLPDYASVNLSEGDAPAVIDLLYAMGVGVEAGLTTVEDAKRFVALPNCRRALRILIEIELQDLAKADAIAEGIAQVLERAKIGRPILLHGFDATVWHFVRRAHQLRWSTRVGLEDGRQRSNGETASENADLILDAVQIFRPIPS